jgi:hypothetical protein
METDRQISVTEKKFGEVSFMVTEIFWELSWKPLQGDALYHVMTGTCPFILGLGNLFTALVVQLFHNQCSCAVATKI